MDGRGLEYQGGLAWKRHNSVKVRNFTFTLSRETTTRETYPAEP